MDNLLFSQRAASLQASAIFRMAYDFFGTYNQRRQVPNTLDFAYGNPHDMADPAYVEALGAALIPRDESWFAYKSNEAMAQEAAAASLSRVAGMPFEPADIFMTTGGFTAISLALKAVADPGDEVVFNLPPWFFYEPLAIEAGLVPVKVGINQTTFDLDVEAIAVAITPRTKVVIVNSPNNPTGKLYPPRTLERLAAVLDEASMRHGRRIFLVSDEPYNRIVYDGATFHSPVAFYPYSLLAYSYGKTLLAPGQRIGYLALPPTMPDRDELRRGIETLQMSIGWAFPNAILQYAVPRLEELSIDVGRLQRKRDHMVAALQEMGYRVHRPEGTFYLFPESPLADDREFSEMLAGERVLVIPGTNFETPGYFRISLTAREETIEQSLPAFARVIARARDTAPAELLVTA